MTMIIPNNYFSSTKLFRFGYIHKGLPNGLRNPQWGGLR
jgi:hypothetical protein